MENVVQFNTKPEKLVPLDFWLSQEELEIFEAAAKASGLPFQAFVDQTMSEIMTGYLEMTEAERAEYHRTINHFDKHGTTRPFLKVINNKEQ